MLRMKSWLYLLSLLCICAFVSTQAYAKPNPRYASIIIDAETGTVLEAQYADKSLHPASLTKIMTLLMLFEAMDQGRIGLNDRIRISSHAASMVPSKLGLAPGSSIRVKDAIKALVTKSANDVAVAIAEHIGGSERGFAKMMNRKAIQIGMRRTTFVNASGLHNRRQVSTARDMATLAQYVINAYPSYYKYFSLKSFSYGGRTYRNHNKLLKSYSGMDGMKTGYVAASGFNLVASAVRNNRRIIAVVFGGRTSRSRNAHMEVLLDRGFNKIAKIRVARAIAPLPAKKPIILEAIAQLNKVGSEGSARIASINPVIIDSFRELIGEGDSDPTISQRIETGLLAISAHSGQKISASTYNKIIQSAQKQTGKTSAPTLTSPVNSWSIQVGAYNSRATTDRVIHKALDNLPSSYAGVQPMIAPLKTDNGWLFRARLTGLSKQEAYTACKYLKDCLPVAPKR